MTSGLFDFIINTSRVLVGTDCYDLIKKALNRVVRWCVLLYALTRTCENIIFHPCCDFVLASKQGHGTIYDKKYKYEVIIC